MDNGENMYMKSRRFLFTDSNEILAKHFMIGLAPDETSGKMYIETLFPNLYDAKMFKNQRVVMPIHLSITTPSELHQIEPDSKQKLALYKKLRSELYAFNTYVDIDYDYENVLANNAKIEAKKLVK